MSNGFDRYFRLRENHTTVRTELLGGATTFMTMSYIIFVQPAILSQAGMDKGAVMAATCIASAVATLLMGLLANYPIAQAPAMGHNIFFAVIVCGTMGYSWKVALGAVFISGIIQIILSCVGFYGKLVEAVPDALKHAIAVGIGLLIALIGLEYGGVVVSSPGTYVGLGELTSRPVLLVLFGVVLIAILMTRKVPGAILLGILATALLGIPLGIVKYHGFLAAPPSLAPTFLKLDIIGAFKSGFFTVIFVLFFLDMFDCVGTLIGVSSPAGFIKDGKLPRANRAILADALGTAEGALLGTSTVSSYIESATGIAQGARTGLANVFTSLLFIAALFFSPLAEMISGEIKFKDLTLHPIIAPPLIIVGYLMMKSVTQINWDDLTEAIPAFLTIAIMPLTVSITEGIAFGFISYSILKLVSKQGKRVHWLVYLFSVLFILRYILK
ncbi:MAG: NCS2 family permease [Candidatus Aminicenantes bacterium]|nr:NCS2 family permease [Candidatus Aminicenantes bacterium]